MHINVVRRAYSTSQAICSPGAMERGAPHVQYATMRKVERNLGVTFLREWREAAGLTLEGLAAEIGKSHASVSRIELRKQPYSQETLEAIAEVYGCRPEDLLSGPPPDRTQLKRSKRLREAMRLFLELSGDRQERVIADLIDGAQVEGKTGPRLVQTALIDSKPAKTD